MKRTAGSLVFIAYPDDIRYHSTIISNDKWPLALVIDMNQSGTGVHGARYLFDIKANPRLAVAAHSHRVR